MAMLCAFQSVKHDRTPVRPIDVACPVRTGPVETATTKVPELAASTRPI
ncbi:MAG: hypothetical protein H5U40_07390 [Polyangiaceae bacterium]|nr:hypothetical protein [Polyangiaceae bacterium]